MKPIDGYFLIKPGALLMLMAVCCACPSHAQGTSAPLYLFTNGNGSVTPLQAGQLLQVGQNYDMTAMPDAGSLFDSWQQINVFVFTEFLTDPSGNPSTNTSTTLSPTQLFVGIADLTFTMQPVQVLFDDPGVRTISQSIGWQANFVPVPEPPGVALIMFGFAAIAMLRCRRFQ